MAVDLANKIHQGALEAASIHQRAKNSGRPISFADARKRVGQVADFRTLNTQVKRELAARERMLKVAHTAMKAQLRRFGGVKRRTQGRGLRLPTRAVPAVHE